MNKDPESWACVKPECVVEGSKAQVRNVLAMAIEDIALLSEKLLVAKARVSELDALFDRMWEADMRGVERWRSANPGNDLVLPDRSKLTEWLLSERFKPEEGEST